MNEFDIFKVLSTIEYGFITKFGERVIDSDNHFDDYILQSPSELEKSRLGVCWDQVELERFYFEKSPYMFKTFYLKYYDNNLFPTHTFLMFKKNDKYYWFEHSFELFCGIHEYTSEELLITDVKSKFLAFYSGNDLNNVRIFEYTKPSYHISPDEFDEHCVKGIRIA